MRLSLRLSTRNTPYRQHSMSNYLPRTPQPMLPHKVGIELPRRQERQGLNERMGKE